MEILPGEGRWGRGGRGIWIRRPARLVCEGVSVAPYEYFKPLTEEEIEEHIRGLRGSTGTR